jgi:hypothetical protein
VKNAHGHVIKELHLTRFLLQPFDNHFYKEQFFRRVLTDSYLNRYNLCDKNRSFLVSDVMDQHQKQSVDIKYQFLIIKKHLNPDLDPQGPDPSPPLSLSTEDAAR